MDLPLDKDGWSTYILEHEKRIGMLLQFKQIYDDLQFCANPDMGEQAFIAAYEEIYHE